MKLMEHQVQSLERTKNFNRCAYYLDMGLGKTFVGAEKMVRLGEHVNLVICQKSKIQDWLEHFTAHYAEDSHDYCQADLVFNLSNKKQLDKFMSECESASKDEWGLYPYMIVGVINYELAWRRQDLLNLKDFTLMLDESSLIQNEKAKRTKFILKLHPKNVILLSGTPTSGKYEQLWSQCKLLGWKITKKAFWSSYVKSEWIDICGFYKEIVTGYKNVEHLKKKLAQYGAVFMKTEEVLTLPEQIQQKIMLPITKDYKQFMKNRYLVLKDGTELVGDNSLTKILHARQLCGMYHKEKLEAFKDLLESTEDRLIVFYNFNGELNALISICKELDRPVSHVNGQGRDLEAYETEDNSVTLIQYQAGAMGGNFQKANKIIYFTLPLGKGSCDLWEQSKKRIHRIGQNKTCFYYYLLVKGSFEEKNLKALQEGKELTDELFV